MISSEIPENNIHPGQYIKRHILENKGYTQKELAEKLNVSRQTINQIVGGHSNLTTGVAMKFAKEFGGTLEFWLDLQRKYKDTQEYDLSSIEQIKKIWSVHGSHTLVDFEIEQGIDAGIFGVNFSKDRVQPASYDLRVGKKVIINNKNIDLEKNDEITINPGEIVHIFTLEEFDLPTFIMGRVGPMSTLQMSGVSTLHGLQIDPGFKDGPLRITLINLDNSNILNLDFGQPFVSTELQFLSVEPRESYKNKKQTVNNDGSNLSGKTIFSEKIITDENEPITEDDLKDAKAIYRIAKLLKSSGI